MDKTKFLIAFGNKIRTRREGLNLSQAELARRAGYTSRSSIGKIESGKSDVSREKIASLALALQTTPAELLGEEKVANRGLKPLTPYVKLHKLGTIHAGKPICTNQNSDGEWDFADAQYGDGEHFMLDVEGDSMSPTIPSGSEAIIHAQDYADKGQIVAFALDGEYATLKRYYPQPDGTILLRGDNPEAESYIITPQQLANREAFVLGVVKSCKINF